MSDAQDDATPPAGTSAGRDAEPQPLSPVGPSPSYASPVSSRHLGATWQIVASLAVLVGLLTGLVTLIDRFAAAPTPTATPAPTTPSLRVDVSSSEGAAELVGFIEAQSGKLVDLDLSCFETVASPACILEPSGLEVGDSGQEWLLLWLFTETPCFAPLVDQPDETRDLPACQGTHAAWIDPRTEGSRVVLSNIQGAGTIAIKGPFEVVSVGGSGMFPANIRTLELTPHVTRLPAPEAPS